MKGNVVMGKLCGSSHELWNDKCRDIATARTYALAVPFARAGDWIAAGGLAGNAHEWAETEISFRANLSSFYSRDFIDRVVKRVYDEAYGRIVALTTERVFYQALINGMVSGVGDTREEAVVMARAATVARKRYKGKLRIVKKRDTVLRVAPVRKTSHDQDA